MKKELQDLLFQRYPLIFVDRNLSKRESMFRGIQCRDGWFDLIDTLCCCLQIFTNRNSSAQVVAVQVKEKLGLLRFYTNSATEEQLGMIEMAQAMSSRICDECGKPGQPVVFAFYHMTRCVEHAPEGALPIESFFALQKIQRDRS